MKDTDYGTNKRLADLVPEIAMKQKSIYPLKDTILVSGEMERPNLKISSEELYISQEREKEHKNAFSRILIKSPFEEYTKDIYQELSRIKYSSVIFVGESRRKNILTYLQDKVEIAKALLVCKEDFNGINISNAKQKCKLSLPLKENIEAVIESQYKEAQLNYSPITYDEGKDILENHQSEDIQNFIDDYWEEYALENDLSAEEKSGGYSYDDIDNDMIEYFISGNDIKREITPIQVQNTIERLQKEIKAYQKKGAPRTNEKLYSALHVFIKYGCRKKHQHLKYIYECLDHFGLIEESIKNGWSETNKYANIQYMKRLFDECSKYKLIIEPSSSL